MRNQVFKKLFSVLLALIMVAGLLPASVLAEGEGNADSTPAPTEAVQPTESAEPTTPTETETPEVTEIPEPTPENPATTVDPTQGEPTAEPTDEGIMPANVMPVQAETEINYVTKTNSVPLPDGTFYRIVHLDCGRKYFSEAQIKQIIDYAYNYGYTHVELAFGNDGLRFLLNDMEVSANGTTYTSEKVTSAIKAGNKAFYDAGTNELSEEEMGRIIAYAKGKGIGIIPMFDAPGHLQTVIRAMGTLNITVRKDTEYSIPTTSGSSENWAINPIYAKGVNFVQALMQKYITYFAGKGCTMFNIAADECGFTSMSTETYTAYARLVNSMAAMVQNAGMTALAFNDGIYHNNLTTNVEFDTNIAVCYWDATTTKYAPAATLAEKGFKIINTHNKWYYVIGAQDNGWYGATWSIKNMNGTDASDCKANKCDFTDGGYQTKYGCMNAIWCDTPSNGTNMTTIEEHIKALSVVEYNKTFFKQVEAPKTPAVTVSDKNKTVKEVTKTADNTYKVVLKKATEGTAESQTLQLNVANGAEGATYTWASSNEKVATVENGLVTFKGAAGTVTITATPVAATRSINGTAAYSITLNVEVEGDVKLEERPITVTVGGAKTDVIEEYNYSSGTYTTENTAIATVTVTGTDAMEGEPKYNSTSVTYSALASNNTSWTRTKYYYTPDNGTNYYPVYAYCYYRYYYYGYSVTDSASNVTRIGRSSNGDGTVTVYEKTGTAAVPTSTTVTFKGVAVGTTYATIGHVRYTISVVPEDLTNVDPLPVQLWITNNPIEVDTKTYSGGSTSGSFRNNNTWSEEKAWYVNVSAVDAYGVNGVALSKVLPASMQRYENNITYWIAQHTGKKEVKLALWSGKVHTKTNNNIQMVWDADYSNDGDEFNYIRYYSGKWEVSATGNVNDWKEVKGTGSTENYSVCTEQLAVYYMIRSKITEEITTDVADWGYMSSDEKYAEQINTGYYVMLDFAVKIDGADRKPSSFPQADKTFVFHCNRNDTSGAVQNDSSSNLYRRLNNFRAVDNLGENYEVYKVTVTMTNDGSSNSIQNTNSYAYEGKEQIIWAIDEDVRNASGLNNYVSISGANSVYSGCKIGGDPYIRGVEVYNQHGALITYYIRAKAVLSNLRVHYRIEGSDKDFYSYGIIAGENVVFGKDFGKDENSATLLKDNVITDSDGHTITVTAKLEKVDGMGAQYKYGNYTFKGTAREDKDVYLYYTFNANVTFVVDFGLPLKIMPTDVAPNLAIANIESVTASSQMSRYADVTIGDNYSIIYTLKSMISDADLVSVTYEGTNLTTSAHDSAAFNIHIIPATSVYYEDSFAKFYGSDGKEQTGFSKTNEVTAQTPGVWYIDGQEKTANQALEALGQENHKPYGYDPAYDKCTMFSMGSARKVTVNTNGEYAQAKFTFKGTGFDVISLTNNKSGAITVEVLDSTGRTAYTTANKKAFYLVNNYYGYTYNSTTGEWTASPEIENALYQVPVIRVRDLEYGQEYTAVITVDYADIFNKTGDGKYSFWLDAVRVYDPAGPSLNTEYVKDKEGYPQYIKLRDELAKEDGSVTVDSEKLLFIDGAENAAISLYKNYGPNNEVYLAKGQAITFKLAGTDLSKIETVQIGAKAPMSGGIAKLSVNGTGVVEKELSSATEMYYDISAVKDGRIVTITNTGEAILSLTNLKITYTEKGSVSLGAMNAEEQTASVMAVRALFAPAPVEPEPEPEPEKTFEPERFEASWSRNVMQGRKATLTVKTSEDVEAITVDGQTIRSYRTRTERMGFGRRAKRITYREFTYSMVAQESADFSVTAINAEGTESEAITARLTVQKRPRSIRDVWNWFKGWF